MLQKAENLRKHIQFTDIDTLVAPTHLLRKIEKAIDFKQIYPLIENLYSKDTGRPSTDPVILIKIVLIQHLYAIKSLRQTVKEIDMNIAYRWFLGLDLTARIPHFATISYAFSQRFPSELFEKIFALILEEIVKRGYIDAQTIFIDATHIKANANKKKNRKELAQKAARIYDKQLREEINKDRQANGKNPLKNKDNQDPSSTNNKTHKITKSTTDPDSGLFRKGEHKVEFAYSAHVACDKNNFILGLEVTSGNVHDSTAFDQIYEKVASEFEQIEIVAVDAAYKTPWICKQIIQDKKNPSMPYKRPQGKDGYFRPSEYIYDEYHNCVICPNNELLNYRTTNKEGYREYKSDPLKCVNCQYLAKCTQNKNKQKTVTRHIWSEYLEQAEDFRHSPKGKESYRLRSQTIERVFADAKEKHGMRYTLHKGLTRVTNWVRLKFAAMNLKKLAMWSWSGSFFNFIKVIFLRKGNEKLFSVILKRAFLTL